MPVTLGLRKAQSRGFQIQVPTLAIWQDPVSEKELGI